MIQKVLFNRRKRRFPNLQDSLILYKEAIVSAIEEDDLEAASINLKRLISILDVHSKKECRLEKELEEVKKRYLIFQEQNGLEHSL